MGRRKIEIQPLTDDRNRTVTFVKRKAGLFKKAHELSVLCQVDLAVIIVGNNHKIYEFSSVDTGELIKEYQSNIKLKKKPHEQKSPENYGNYKKKKNLSEKLTRKSGAIDDEIDENDIDSEYDSDSPEPKRHKRSFSDMKYSGNNNTSNNNNSNSKVFNSNRPPPPPPPHHISLTNIPTFNNPNNYRMKEEDNTPGSTHSSNTMDKISHKRDDSTSSNQRPVLRVQIPTDSKSNASNNKSSVNDSARTITAIDTNLQNTSSGAVSGNNDGSNGNRSNGATDSAGPQSNSSDISITNNSSNSITNAINAANNNPSLLGGANNLPTINTPKYSSFKSFRSPDSRKPTLPIPIHSKSQTSSPASATAPPLPIVNSTTNASATNANVANNMYYSSMPPQGSPSNPYPNGILPTPILNQVFNQQYNQPSANTNEAHNNKFRPPIFTNLPNNAGEQTPISGLPSRYVNDMFPSPSNFYAPQDWPGGNTGMTPIHTNIPQYFMNMLSSAGPTSAYPGGNALKGVQQPLPQHLQQQQQQSSPQQKEDGVLSPINFIGSATFSGAPGVGGQVPGGPNANSGKMVSEKLEIKKD
ncbi:transcription factor of the MADS box family [Scheffersomyces xylosifermentans]|uniref:transcription factor of the MADS box family n=1 Tax=Scheffersomyces xylosifermentans TaxID=1304137 RepID=UPI00315DD99E